ncbi:MULTISPECIES: peptidoglycan DD-metalloendopeptidase family protein [unclassified Streptomyces]|uniref:peptidoglycan DD-metalloendopeptidase family protein n=1 Tax=unclassified Streptomyces TaxID=2593676 RepID=UPI003D749EDC
MRSLRRRPLLVSVLLCAAAVLAARPTTADGEYDDGRSGAGAEVARLYAEAAAATRQWEEGRRAADAQRAEAERIEGLLGRERRELASLREDLGRIARAQYRDGGGLPAAAQLVLAGSTEDLMRGQRVFSQANQAVDNAIDKSRRAERRLAADEARAATAWRALERRNAELASLKKDIEHKLQAARIRLQGQADASAAAGACRGAVRLDQPSSHFTSAWVAPVEAYAMSAGFGSGGSRWANRHTGQDFAVPIGTPVRAVGEGRVVRVACGGAFGMQVVLEHPGGYYTQYAHLASVAVDQGERVATGQWIGQSGTTGNSTGPHLHFEVRVTPETGSAVNPVPWLAARGVPVG